jgi:hypothetical protein
LSLAVGGVADEAEDDDADGETGQRLHAALWAIEQHVLDEMQENNCLELPRMSN